MRRERLDVALIGCGTMGAHHARTIAAHPRCRLVATVDVDPDRARSVAATHGAEAHQRVPDGVAAVVVASPTASHRDLAEEQLAAGRWCLVEKPLARSSEDARVLCSPRLAVGHVERFNPAVRAAGRMDPRFVEARRLIRPTPRATDVCVVMDLMVHDLDLLAHWSTGTLEVVDAVGVAVRSDDIDVASVRLATSDGIRAHLLASRVAEVPERLVRVYEEQRTTRLDLLGGRARRDDGPLDPPSGGDGLSAQWDAFVRAVFHEAPLAASGEDGWRMVALAEAIRARMTEGDARLRLVGAGGWR